MISRRDPVALEVPEDGDASELGVMHLRSWQQTHPSAEHGIDAGWIDEHVGFVASPAADDFRRRLFAAQRVDPSSTYYRLARHGGEVVGFVHASRSVHVSDVRLNEGASGAAGSDGSATEGDATLEALYLLREHQGTGLADQMMAGALDWLDGRSVRLEVASYNARAIAFYRRYGFRPTGETEMFREALPTLAMRRDHQIG